MGETKKTLFWVFLFLMLGFPLRIIIYMFQAFPFQAICTFTLRYAINDVMYDLQTLFVILPMLYLHHKTYKTVDYKTLTRARFEAVLKEDRESRFALNSQGDPYENENSDFEVISSDAENRDSIDSVVRTRESEVAS